MVLILIIVAVLVFVGLFIAYTAEVEKSKNKKENNGPKIHYYSDAVASRAKDMEKLEGLIASYDEKFTNKMIQTELSTSMDATKRYLTELEKQGIIRQVGESGDTIYYKKF